MTFGVSRGLAKPREASSKSQRSLKGQKIPSRTIEKRPSSPFLPVPDLIFFKKNYKNYKIYKILKTFIDFFKIMQKYMVFSCVHNFLWSILIEIAYSF